MATVKTPKSVPAAPAKKAAAPAPVAKSAGAAAVPAAEPEIVETAAAPEPAPAPAAAPAPAKAAEPAVLLPSLSAVVEPVLHGVDDLLDFSKANAEAVVAAGHSLASGLQHIAHGLIELSQESIEKGVAHGKKLAGATSVQDVIELSQNAAKDSLDKLLAEGSKIGTLSSKLVEESFAPLRKRVVAVVEKFTSHAA
jgi:phasin family protein